MNLRDAVHQRDRGVCAKCGCDSDRIRRVYFRITGDDAQKLYRDHVGSNGKVFWEADHIMERALFVDNSLGNMQTLCVECHRKKTTMFMRERSSQAMVLRRAGDMEVRRRETEMEARKRQTRERLEEERRFRNEVACIEREILEAQGVKFAPRDVGDRVQYVLDHVHAYIDGQIAENGDWPKTLQPIASDYAADLWTVGGD